MRCYPPEGDFTENAQDIYLKYVFENSDLRLQSHLPGANELRNTSHNAASIGWAGIERVTTYNTLQDNLHLYHCDVLSIMRWYYPVSQVEIS